MEQICDNNKCSGCCACMNACPKECITMEYDKFGVMLPKIRQETCIDCGLCTRVCPVNSKTQRNTPQKAYAAWHLDADQRKKSASGGVAAAFYETVLEQGGVCFGTSFDSDLNLTVKSAITDEEIRQFRGSKYVQAYVGNQLKQVKKYLDMDKKVLFVGTPCQVAGLNQYLRKEYPGLVTVDLICHGVPSVQYLRSHVNEIEGKIKKRADNITFRGEHSFELALYQSGELIYKKYRFLDSYFTGFLNGLFYRPNCYECPYACENRVSDITIGDFWGLGREAPCDYKMGDGVSVILPNTAKGEAFVQLSAKRLFMDERPLSEAVHGNDQLRHPSPKHENYDRFRELYPEEGFERAAAVCTKDDIAKWKKDNHYTIVRRAVRKVKYGLKKVLGK